MREPAVSFHRSQVPRRHAIPAWRSKCLLALLGLAGCALVVRALWVQGVDSNFYVQQGQRRYERSIPSAYPRARVLDRNGVVLAISESVQDMWIVPQEFAAASAQDRADLARDLALAPEEVQAKAASDKRFLYLKRAVPTPLALTLRKRAIPGLNFTETTRRSFPEGADIAPLLGIISQDGQGQEGIELARDAQLQGRAGRRNVIIDRLGREVDAARPGTPAQAGQDVRLSIDMRLQRSAMIALAASIEKFGAAAGCAIVVDTRSGEILALANLPSFDPNAPGGYARDGMRNRALVDTFEPGSTLKPLTVAAALTAGRITATTRIDTSPGVIEVYGNRIRDTSNHGELDIRGVVAKSSNIGMVRIAQTLSAQQMWDNFRLFGLGDRPIADYPGVTPGSLRPAARWKPIEQATMAYGYGLAVSLAQLAEAYTAFGNDGLRVPLSLYAAAQPAPPVRVATPEIAWEVLGMLEAAVEPGGTARVARMERYRVGAKTGTARKQVGRGYAPGKYRAVFVGLAPLSHPRLVVAVMIDEPSRGSYYGGPVAGPVFAQIMRDSLRILGVPPDLDRGEARQAPPAPRL